MEPPTPSLLLRQTDRQEAQATVKVRSAGKQFQLHFFLSSCIFFLLPFPALRPLGITQLCVKGQGNNWSWWDGWWQGMHSSHSVCLRN